MARNSGECDSRLRKGPNVFSSLSFEVFVIILCMIVSPFYNIIKFILFLIRISIFEVYSVLPNALINNL